MFQSSDWKAVLSLIALHKTRKDATRIIGELLNYNALIRLIQGYPTGEQSYKHKNGFVSVIL